MDDVNCPDCGSGRIEYKHTAQTIGQAIGAIGGLLLSAYPFNNDRDLPEVQSAQQVMQYINFAKTGAMVGGQIGMAIDQYLLHNAHCFDCGGDFKPFSIFYSGVFYGSSS